MVGIKITFDDNFATDVVRLSWHPVYILLIIHAFLSVDEMQMPTLQSHNQHHMITVHDQFQTFYWLIHLVFLILLHEVGATVYLIIGSAHHYFQPLFCLEVIQSNDWLPNFPPFYYAMWGSVQEIKGALSPTE